MQQIKGETKTTREPGLRELPELCFDDRPLLTDNTTLGRALLPLAKPAKTDSL